MENLLENLDLVGKAAAIVIITVFGIVGGGVYATWKSVNRRTDYDDDREICGDQPNYALAVLRVAFVLVPVLVTTAFLGERLHTWWSIAVVAGVFVGTTLFAMFVRRFGSIFFLGTSLGGVKKMNLVRLGPALAMTGVFILYAFALYGIATGFHPNSLKMGMVATAVLFAVSLVAAPLTHGLIRLLGGHRLARRIRDEDHVPAGVMHLGQSVFIGAIMYKSTAGDFYSYPELAIRSVSALITAVVFGLLLAKLIDLAFLRLSQDQDITIAELLDRRNAAAMIVLSGITIIAGLTVAAGFDGLATYVANIMYNPELVFGDGATAQTGS